MGIIPNEPLFPWSDIIGIVSMIGAGIVFLCILLAVLVFWSTIHRKK